MDVLAPVTSVYPAITINIAADPPFAIIEAWFAVPLEMVVNNTSAPMVFHPIPLTPP